MSQTGYSSPELAKLTKVIPFSQKCPVQPVSHWHTPASNVPCNEHFSWGQSDTVATVLESVVTVAHPVLLPSAVMTASIIYKKKKELNQCHCYER